MPNPFMNVLIQTRKGSIMPNFIVLHEGLHIDYAANGIVPIYVDFRMPSSRLPVTSLIKACRRQHAIELCKKIHISKPTQFRKYGEKLILDPSEAKVSHTKVSEKYNDPEDIADAQASDDELARAFRALGTKAQFTTHNIKKTYTQTNSLSGGRNGWIFSTTIQTTNSEEEDEWWKSMPDGYDHATHICRPRDFARALGSMVAEQLEPRGPEVTWNYSFDGHKFKTKHKTQVIYHGPVTYESDPFDRFCKSSTKFESQLLPLFLKGRDYKNQREYRFFIHTEEEPSEETIDLDVSLTMLGATIEPHKAVLSQVFLIVVPFKPSVSLPDACADGSGISVIENMKSFSLDDHQTPTSDSSDLNAVVSDPSFPVAPDTCDVEESQRTVYDTVAAHSAISALRNRIEMLARMGSIPRARHALVKSSAWNADFCIRHLCSIFDDPIKNMSISDYAVIIMIKFPYGSDAKGEIFIGPYGTNGYKIGTGNETSVSRNLPLDLWMDEVVEHLKKSGLHIRQDSGSSVNEPSKGG